MLNSKSISPVKQILVFFLTACVLFCGCKKSSPGKPSVNEQNPKETAKESLPGKSIKVSSAIEDVIRNARTWNPILTEFYGKEMPDFKVIDIKGKEYSLKECRGKNVMVVFWATWCQPCIMEMPHLVALREIMPKDKLEILAISKEQPEVVKEMAEFKNLNYTIIPQRSSLPAPFSNVRAIPTTFFIRPDGTLKLVAGGTSQLGEMKAIILAE